MLPADDEVIFMGETWEGYEIQCHDPDPDAVACMQFEEGLGEALQCDSEIAACYNTYLDARKRLAEEPWVLESERKLIFPEGQGKGEIREHVQRPKIIGLAYSRVRVP